MPRSRRASSRRVPLDLRPVLTWLVIAKVVGLVLIFDPLGLQSFHLPKSLYSRTLEWATVAALAIVLVLEGRSAVPRSRVHVLVGAWLVVQVIATAVAEDRYIATFGDTDRYLGLTAASDLVVLYLAVVVGFRHVRDWALLGGALAAATVVAGAYAFVQAAGFDPLTSSRLAGRAIGMFGNADIFGHYLGAAVGAATAVVVLSDRPQARLIAAAPAIIGVVALGLTGTRGALIGVAAAGFALLVAVAASRIRSRRPVITRRLSVTVLGGAIAVAAILAMTPMGSRVALTLQGVGVQDRLLTYDAALRATLDRPFLGYGPDNFGVAFPQYRQEAYTQAVLGLDQSENSAHNWLLQAAATTGIPGAVLTLGLVFVPMVMLVRDGFRRSPVVAGALMVGGTAYWVHGLVTVGSIGVDWIPWVVLGGSILPIDKRRVPFGRLPVMLLAVVGLAALAGVLSSTGAFEANRAAGAAMRAGDADAGLSAARAVELDPGRAEHWNVLGIARDRAGQRTGAADAYAEAARRAPHVAAYWINLARSRGLEAQATGADAARRASLEAAATAVRKSPNDPRTHLIQAQISAAFEQHEVAVRAAARAIQLGSREPILADVAASSAPRIADAQSARALLEGSIAIQDGVRVRLALARLLLRSDERITACEHAGRASQLEPTNNDAATFISANCR